jgi:hypothetical protein
MPRACGPGGDEHVVALVAVGMTPPRASSGTTDDRTPIGFGFASSGSRSYSGFQLRFRLDYVVAGRAHLHPSAASLLTVPTR